MTKKYHALAYYKFVPLEYPRDEVKKHQDFFQNKDVTGRIYISDQGINGQMSGLAGQVKEYIDWLCQDSRFSNIYFKIHETEENVFPRMTVKYRKQLVAIDIPVDLSKTGEHLSPKQWKETLENEKDILLVDVRNDYEWKIGHFEGSILPPLETFRDFPRYADQLKEEVGTQKKILMYCTGGIRCEIYSALLKEKGFEKVYQLEGGIIGYGLEEGNAHYKGKVFVFDDRLAVPIDNKNSPEPISQCLHCHLSCDTYYNCANMDCNELFIACLSCLHTYVGCCSFDCKEAPRLRPYHQDGSHKPFRRQHLVEKEKKD